MPRPIIFWLALSLVALPPQAAAQQGGAARETPDRFGPLTVYSEDGRDALSLGLAAQLRATVNPRDLVEEGPQTTETTVQFRRIRFRLRGRLIDDRISTLLQFDFAPRAPQLMDLYLQLQVTPMLKIRVGQHRLPLARYGMQWVTWLPLAEWPITAPFFGNERQIGITVHNGNIGTPPRWEYALGIYTGEPRHALHGAALAKDYGELPTNPSSLRDTAAPGDINPEIALHLGYNSPGMKLRAVDNRTTPFGYAFALAAAWDIRPTAAREPALRVSADAALKLGPVTLSTVGYLALIETVADSELQLGLLGVLAEAGWRFLPRWELLARYAVVRRTRRLLEDARAHADERIAAAAEQQQQEAIERYREAGMIEGDHEVGGGVTFYLRGDAIKLQTDVTLLRFDRDDATFSDDLRIQVQIQLEI
jgi:hypothetical protein